MEANEGWLGERAEWRQGARLASSPPGTHKGPASRGDHGPANPWYPLKRTDIVWPALWCLKISIPLGNLSCCGYQGEKMIWWCKVSFGRGEDSFSCHCKSVQAFILKKCVFTKLLPCYQSKVMLYIAHQLLHLCYSGQLCKTWFLTKSPHLNITWQTRHLTNKQACCLVGVIYWLSSILMLVLLDVNRSPKMSAIHPTLRASAGQQWMRIWAQWA